MTAITWILVALGFLALALSQVRLRTYRGTGGLTDIAPWMINVHTVAGVIGFGLVALRLMGTVESTAATWVAIIALAIASVVGLTFLTRWRRTGGRHVDAVEGDAWTSGPWLSRIAHYGVLLGSIFLAWAMLSDRI